MRTTSFMSGCLMTAEKHDLKIDNLINYPDNFLFHCQLRSCAYLKLVCVFFTLTMML
jgi:hypothetical protein